MSKLQMAARLKEETLDSLRNKPIRSSMLESMQLIDEADALVAGLPQPLALGKALNYIFANASLPIRPWDLLVGRTPEVEPNAMQEEFLTAFRDKYGWRPHWMVDGGHITFAWDMLLEKGLGGLMRETRQKADEFRNVCMPQAKIDFLDGMALIYRAYSLYIHRYAEQAQKRGKPEVSKCCRAIETNPPQTFQQALQLILLVGHAYSTYASVNSTLCYGRMDELLLPYYLRDLENGILTSEEAGALIDDFNCKNNLILGRGEHQMSGDTDTDTTWFRNPTYDTPQYVILGGYSNRLPSGYENPLTKLFLDHIVPRFENPVYVLRLTKTTPSVLLELVCDKMRQNASMLVYNDETEIPAFCRAGISEQDAREYTIHGCNWPDIAGEYSVMKEITVRFPHFIMQALLDEEDNLKCDFQNIDEIYAAVLENIRQEIRQVFTEYRSKVAKRTLAMPRVLSCTDCFTKGPLEYAGSMGDGCVKYPVIYTGLRYIGTAADMLSAIETVVFREKAASLSELALALKKNFRGYEELRAKLLAAPKYGCDDDRADQHAVRLMTETLNLIDRETMGAEGTRDVISFNVTITDMDHIPDGKRLGATPDGRLANTPISENLSPTVGAATKGITALLCSVAKLPFDRIHSGALNVRARRDWLTGNEGLMRLKALLQGYFSMGGMQLQLSVADTAELRSAQKEPYQYRDLMVRITGYSAAFVDMSRKAQEEIIRREEMI